MKFFLFTALKIMRAANHSKNPYAICKANKVFNDHMNNKGEIITPITIITESNTIMLFSFMCFPICTDHKDRQNLLHQNLLD
jgi:hypothetical protein